jgi:hypothetical protein
MNLLSSYIQNLPDASLRKPLTLTDVVPVVLCYYAHAVMAMLPYTFGLRVALLPFTLWLAWNSAVTLDVAQYLSNTLGVASNPLRISHLNFVWVVSVFAFLSQSRSWFRRFLTARDVGRSAQIIRVDIHY